jgi:hypothetical protein
MAKKKSSNVLGVILLIIIWVALSVRFMLRFYSFYYIIPIRAELVWVFKDDKMVTSSLIFGIIWIVGWIMILLFLIKLKTNKDRLRLWIWAIIFWLVINLLFYLINPWYTLQTHPRLFFYQDWKNITNIERYFYLTEKYWYDYTLYKPFKTLEDSIDWLEFAKKIKEPSLYKTIFEDSEKFWYGELLKKYNDNSFQLYFLNYVLFTSAVNNWKINNLDININYLNLLLSNSSNNEIITLSNELLNKLNYASKLDKNDMKQTMDDYLKEYLDKIFGTKTIDKSIFL